MRYLQTLGIDTLKKTITFEESLILLEMLS